MNGNKAKKIRRMAQGGDSVKIEVLAQVAKISTLADGSIRLAVDIQPENAPDDLITWIYKNVTISIDLVDR